MINNKAVFTIYDRGDVSRFVSVFDRADYILSMLTRLDKKGLDLSQIIVRRNKMEYFCELKGHRLFTIYKGDYIGTNKSPYKVAKEWAMAIQDAVRFPNLIAMETDEIAADSHFRASAAISSGALRDEIVPVMIPQRKGDPIEFVVDEGVREGTDSANLGKLRPAFAESGNITAGNASQISDGGSAIVVVSKTFADNHGVSPLASLISYGQVAGPDTSLLTQPSRAILKSLESVEVGLDDIDLFEINEAFAAVSAASVEDLGISSEVVNINGGAIALGHPIGMSGNRLALTLAYALRRQGGGLGAAALCGGGGQGDALILKV